MIDRIKWIDSVRAICILWIVAVWHLDEYFYNKNVFYNAITENVTYYMLCVFSIFAGYFAYYRSGEVYSWKMSLVFWKKKLIRSYPLFALSCLMMVRVGQNSKKDLIRYLVCCGEFSKPYPTTIWFISMLYIFFLITPIVAQLMKRGLITQFVVGFGICVLFYELSILYDVDSRIYGYWLFYFGGMIISEYSLFEYIDYIHYKMLIVFGCIYIVLSIVNCNSFLFQFLKSCLFILIWLKVCKAIFNHRGCRFLEIISYSSMSMYLYHRYIFGVLFERYGPVNYVEGYLFYLPSVILFSYAIQKTYDWICINGKKIKWQIDSNNK